jgi:hypothetical protein
MISYDNHVDWFGYSNALKGEKYTDTKTYTERDGLINPHLFLEKESEPNIVYKNVFCYHRPYDWNVANFGACWEPNTTEKRHKIWGFYGGDYEEWRLLGYKPPVRTSQKTHYVSATQSNKSMLCKVWGFHGGDYKELRLLVYKNPVRTSKETHYVSATECSELKLCKI